MSREPAKIGALDRELECAMGEAESKVSLMKNQKNAMIVAAVLLTMFLIGFLADVEKLMLLGIFGTLILQGMRSR
jgi:hypothetical protein